MQLLIGNKNTIDVEPVSRPIWTPSAPRPNGTMGEPARKAEPWQAPPSDVGIVSEDLRAAA